MTGRRLLFAVLVTLAVASCENSPFEPRGEGERVPINHEITDEISGDTAGRYSFAGQADVVFAIFLQALQGTVSMVVVDSTHQLQVASLFSGPGSPPLYENPSTSFSTAKAAVYNITVRAPPPGSHARFRFIVYPINRAPELTPSTFALGDTVMGETIDPMVDLDDFFAHGEAGQEIVAVGETPAPAGSGSVAISVIDPVANNFLGYVFADAGTTTPFTTGRLRMPGTHDYRFIAGSVTSNIYPRYRGPYRFWTYVINPAPEHRSPSIPFNTEIASERIDRAGDADEFRFGAGAGADFNAFVQGAARTFQVEVSPAGGSAIAVASSQPSDTALFSHATSRFRTTTAGTYVLRVTASTPTLVADTGAYRVYLYAINRQPEHVAAAITPGDTVSGEDIALPGDLDDFTFTAAPGEEYNAFLQAQNGSGDTHLQLEVLQPGGSVLRSAQSLGSDTSLLNQVTGRFAIPTAGTYVLRVSGSQSYNDQDRGPYRLFLYRINRKPETSPDILAFGDSLSGEAIELPGDVDEVGVTVTDSSGANLAFALEDPPLGGYLTVQLLNSTSGQVLATSNTYTGGRAALGRMRLAPGRYLVRIDGNQYGNQYGERSTLRGPYRLWFYRFGYSPEIAADTFAIGDTVSGESVEPWGDADQFRFYSLQNQHVNIMLQGLSAPSSGAFQLWVTPPVGVGDHGVVMFAGTSTSALQDRQSGRVDLPATGWYTAEVSGYSGAFNERGPYRFTVMPIDPGPEHVSAALGVGDSVTTELIDVPGDIDEFTVTGPPGQDVSLVIDGRDGYVGPFVRVWVFDPATFDTLAEQPAQFHRIAGPFRVPTAGQFKIDVREPRGLSAICFDPTCSGFSFVGPYGFHVVTVNRAPENNPAAYTVGDTVRGETIDPVGDIDEFTASGTPGELLTPFVRLTAQSPLDSAIVLEVIDPSTPGGALIGSNAAFFGATFGSPGSFTVPTSGTFVIRAHVFGEQGFGVGKTAYEFFVKRGP